MDPKEFKKIVYSYYKTHGRHSLPWRKTVNPYKILVSEVMLQQTQADRVALKFRSFIKKFPTVRALAKAPLREVLLSWQGLGYNRRALYLKKMAEAVTKKYKGKIPSSLLELETLPGIGPYTARAVRAFALNEPEVFIETNIRTVYLHHFFADKDKVRDELLIPLIKKTLDQKNPREWYSALMDYGSHLKKTVPNPSRRSHAHVKQSAFKGSVREVRGKILALVMREGAVSLSKVKKELAVLGKDKITRALSALIREGLISQKGTSITTK